MNKNKSVIQAVKAHPIVIIFLAACILSPLLFQNTYFRYLLSEIFFYAAMGCAWNILGGFGRQISWCSASFVAIGAYTTSIFFVDYGGISPWLTIWLGIALSVVLAIIIGLPCFRLRGTFFSIATIAFATIVRQLLLNFPDFTGGAQGISFKITSQTSFWSLMIKSDVIWMYISLGIMLLTVLITVLINRSNMGYYLKAVREDEVAAESLGIRPHRLKLAAFMISAALLSVIGCFYAFMKTYIDPMSFASHDLSVKIGVMAILGGMGAIWGPVLGAFIAIPAMEIANYFFADIGAGGAGLVLYGLIIILVVLIRPNGLISLFENRSKKSKKTPINREGAEGNA